MQTYHASAVSVFADTDYGEGWIAFEWPEELSGSDCLQIDLEGHCSRRMPFYSGSGLEGIELSRDRIRLRFTPALAEKLRLGSDMEIRFSATDEVFTELRNAIDYLGGDVTDAGSPSTEPGLR